MPTQLEACVNAPACNVLNSPSPSHHCGAAHRIHVGARNHLRTVIVAVRFNEDMRAICWLASLPVYRVYLLNKGAPLSAKASSLLSPRVVELRTANIGRESYSYLHALRYFRGHFCNTRTSRIIFMQANHRNPIRY